MITDDETFETDEHSNNVPVKPVRNLRSLADRAGSANSLTKKDKLILFAGALAEGFDVSSAYIRAFGDTRPTVAHKKGFKLSQEPKILDMVAAERTRRQSRGVEEGERLRLMLVSRLEYEAIHAKADSARIAALRMIGELGHVQAFKPPLPGDIPEVPSDIQSRVKEMLGRLGISPPDKPSE
jgi:hypothetical protein